MHRRPDEYELHESERNRPCDMESTSSKAHLRTKISYQKFLFRDGCEISIILDVAYNVHINWLQRERVAPSWQRNRLVRQHYTIRLDTVMRDCFSSHFAFETYSADCIGWTLWLETSKIQQAQNSSQEKKLHSWNRRHHIPFVWGVLWIVPRSLLKSTNTNAWSKLKTVKCKKVMWANICRYAYMFRTPAAF